MSVVEYIKSRREGIAAASIDLALGLASGQVLPLMEIDPHETIAFSAGIALYGSLRIWGDEKRLAIMTGVFVATSMGLIDMAHKKPLSPDVAFGLGGLVWEGL